LQPSAIGRLERRVNREKLEQSLFLTLDGMRGVGAILVVMSHGILFWGVTTSVPPIPFCVDLFFIMSGFVLAFVYEPRFAEGMTAATFMRHRLVRLYPLYLLGVLMGGAVLALAAVGDVQKTSALGLSLVPQLLMLPSPDFNGSGDLYPLNMPSWTLLFELWVNLIFVLVWRWLSMRVLAVIVALSAAALAAVTFAYGHMDLGPGWANFLGGFARAMFGFFMGVMVFRLIGAPKQTPRKRSWWALPALAVVPALCLIPDLPVPRTMIELAIVCVVGPVLLWWASSFQPPRIFTVVFGWLGMMSYALYMLHYPIFEFMKRVAGQYPELYEVYAPWTGAAMLAVSLLVSAVAMQVYDTPMRRWLNARFRSLGRKPARKIVPAE
jgi:peptidoglycan/LPS O-acetylase OafA/YrhL